LACASPASSNGDIEYFYEVITDATGTTVVAYAVKDLRRITEVRQPP
jgi:hypothetical protein